MFFFFCARVYICVCLYMFVYVYFLCARVYICVCFCIYICMYLRSHGCMYLRSHGHMCVREYMCIRMCIFMYIFVYIHIYYWVYVGMCMCMCMSTTYINVPILTSRYHHYLMLTPDSLSKVGHILKREDANRGQIKGIVTTLGLDEPTRVTLFLLMASCK